MQHTVLGEYCYVLWRRVLEYLANCSTRDANSSHMEETALSLLN
jgi:hypothetical protein